MLCSTSVGIHLLRGAAAFALIFSVLYFSLGWMGSALAIVGAVVLLRGCPMCWLMGLFETMARRRQAEHRDIKV